MSSHSLIANRFLLREQLGTGGMGRVWLAFDQTLHRLVAVKEVVPPRGLPDSQLDRLSEMVFREAQAAAQVDHPNVVRIHDIVQWGRWPWIVMQYVPSRSLQTMVKVDGPVDLNYAAQIGLALADALIATHQAGVLHRDVTPNNVLIARDNRVMLGDFGLALWRSTDNADPMTTMGTMQYMAPERAISGLSTAEGDCWSLGATLYAAVEGRPPYARSSASVTLSALVADPPDPPRQAGQLTGVIQGLLQREPQRRLTAVQARHALRRHAVGPSWPGPQRREAANRYRATTLAMA